MKNATFTEVLFIHLQYNNHNTFATSRMNESINQHIYLNITATVAGFKKHTRISSTLMNE